MHPGPPTPALCCERCRGVGEAETGGGGAGGSLPVNDGGGAAVVAAADQGLGRRGLLGLSLRGLQQMSAGVRHGVDLVSGAAPIETEEEAQGEAREESAQQSQMRLSEDIREEIKKNKRGGERG